MVVSTSVVARRYEDVSAGTPISVDIPAYEAGDVYVYYGNASLVAVQGTDYTVALAGDFETFTVTPTASLLTKINALIAADATEENFITVRRTLDYLTDATPDGVRYTPFTSREFDRNAMRDLQLADLTRRSLRLPDTNVPEDNVDASTVRVGNGQYIRRKADGTGFEGVDPQPQFTEVDAWYQNRDVTSANQAALLTDGSVVALNGLSYRVDSTATGTASATNDLGVSGLVPYGAVYPEHFGAVGDNVTNDQSAIQAALNWIGEGGVLFLWPQALGYKASSLQLQNGQSIIGYGRHKDGITGDGTGVLIKTNVYGSGSYPVRGVNLHMVKLKNSNYDTVQLHVSPDSSIQHCQIECTGATALSQILSFRCSINANRILSSGDVTTWKVLDNCNGSDNSNNTVSAGLATNGLAVDIGRTQSLNMDHLVVEVGGGRGVSVGGPGSESGNCSAISLRGLYIKQVKRPIEIGLQFSVIGIDLTGLYIGNTSTRVIAARDSAIHIGRVTGLVMPNFYPNGTGTEALFELYDVNGGVGPNPFLENSVIASANVEDYPTLFVKNAGFTVARENRIFGKNDIRLGTAVPIGIEREWVSPVITANVAYPISQCIEATPGGGMITAVDIIDKVGTVICIVQIGTSVSISEIASFNPNSLTYTEGTSRVVDEGDNKFLRVGLNGRVKTVAGAGTGTFRIRVRYRV